MKFNGWRSGKGPYRGRMARLPKQVANRLIAALKIPAPGTSQLMRRIQIMERDIVLPIKAAGIAMLLHSFYLTPWIGRVSSALDVAVESTLSFFWIYIAFNLVIGLLLVMMHHLPPALI